VCVCVTVTDTRSAGHCAYRYAAIAIRALTFARSSWPRYKSLKSQTNRARIQFYKLTTKTRHRPQGKRANQGAECIEDLREDL